MHLSMLVSGSEVEYLRQVNAVPEPLIARFCRIDDLVSSKYTQRQSRSVSCTASFSLAADHVTLVVVVISFCSVLAE